MEGNRKRRKKDDVSEMSVLFEKCSKDNSKTHFCFFWPNFLSTRKATIRRVHITIVHIKRERIGKKSREKVKRINHFFRGFFWWQKQRDTKKLSKKRNKNTENGNMKNQICSKKRFPKKRITRIFFRTRTKRRMIFLNFFSQKQNEFFF